jgi:hypothetical protein
VLWLKIAGYSAGGIFVREEANIFFQIEVEGFSNFLDQAAEHPPFQAQLCCIFDILAVAHSEALFQASLKSLTHAEQGVKEPHFSILRD